MEPAADSSDGNSHHKSSCKNDSDLRPRLALDIHLGLGDFVPPSCGFDHGAKAWAGMGSRLVCTRSFLRARQRCVDDLHSRDLAGVDEFIHADCAIRT